MEEPGVKLGDEPPQDAAEDEADGRADEGDDEHETQSVARDAHPFAFSSTNSTSTRSAPPVAPSVRSRS